MTRPCAGTQKPRVINAFSASSSASRISSQRRSYVMHHIPVGVYSELSPAETGCPEREMLTGFLVRRPHLCRGQHPAPFRELPKRVAPHGVVILGLEGIDELPLELVDHLLHFWRPAAVGREMK